MDYLKTVTLLLFTVSSFFLAPDQALASDFLDCSRTSIVMKDREKPGAERKTHIKKFEDTEPPATRPESNAGDSVDNLLKIDDAPEVNGCPMYAQMYTVGPRVLLANLAAAGEEKCFYQAIRYDTTSDHPDYEEYERASIQIFECEKPDKP